MFLVSKTLAFGVRVRQALGSRWRNLYFRALGVTIPVYSSLRRIEIPRNWAGIRFLGQVSLETGVVLLAGSPNRKEQIVLHGGVYINRNSMLDAHERIEIGPGCMLGPSCYLTDADHGMTPGLAPGAQPMNTAPVKLEANVWLGAGVTVLKGVTIGAGTVVGAGSVVTKDLPAGVVAAGVPARVLHEKC